MTSLTKAKEFHFVRDRDREIALHVPSMTVLDLHPAAAELLRNDDRGGAGDFKTKNNLPSAYPRYIISAARSALNRLDVGGHLEPVKLLAIDDQEFPSLLWMHVSHACNMRCVYCFADHGKYNGPSSLMSIQTAQKTIDWVLSNKSSNQKVHVLFFGGEPLLNFEVIKSTVQYATERDAGNSFVWGLITNGILLSREITDFLVGYGVHITVSIDGPAKVQRKLRPRKDGRECSSELESSVKYLLSRSNLPVSVRATVTQENLDLISSFNYFRDLGFRYISLMPALGTCSDRWVLQPGSWSVFLSQLSDIASVIVNRAVHCEFIHVRPLDNYLEKIHSGIVTGNCGAAVEGLAISPEGHLFPCSRFVGIDAFRCGDISEQWDASSGANFKRKSTLTEPRCKDCWARYFCEGGCPYYNFQAHGDPSVPTEDYCSRHIQLTELALLTYAELARRPGVLEAYFGSDLATN